MVTFNNINSKGLTARLTSPHPLVCALLSGVAHCPHRCQNMAINSGILNCGSLLVIDRGRSCVVYLNLLIWYYTEFRIALEGYMAEIVLPRRIYR